MTVAMMDRPSIHWDAYVRVREHYRSEFGPESSNEHFRDWMLHTWGINQRSGYTMVDDEQKYTMFLLRFA